MSAPTSPDPAIVVAGGVPAQRAVTVLPAGIHPAPESRGGRTSGNPIDWNREEPGLLAAGLREAFRPLR